MAKSDHLDQAQQASAASIPALRAVIAGVREHEAAAREYLDGFSPRICENVWALVLLRDLAWEITTLADACERLAEENERLRTALDALEAHHVEQNREKRRDESRSTTLRLIRAAITPAPAGKGEG